MTWLLCILLVLDPRMATAAFSPDMTDFDAYGLKIAANDDLFAQAKNQGRNFLVQFGSQTNRGVSLQCSLDYDDPSHYVYSVAIGAKQSLTNQPLFYYAGEIVSSGPRTADRSNRNGTFIAVMQRSSGAVRATLTVNRKPPLCQLFQEDAFQNLASYDHQEYFVIAVEPFGSYAIGIATDFVFRYKPYPRINMTSKSTSALWPNNATFQPCAADASVSFTVVAGFVGSGTDGEQPTPTVYLLSNSNLTVLSSWSYSPPENSWQAHLTYSGVESWSAKLTMSVKINGDDPTRVLVGMPFLNTVFLFQVDNNGTSLAIASFVTMNKSVGFGKSVTWMSSTQAAILYSAYSPDYTTWYSSKVYVYNCLNDTILPSSPTAVIPNSQQPLPSTINAKFIRLISTPSAVGILDQSGGALIILAESPGRYASTDLSHSPVAAAMPVISHSVPCIAGTFKVDTGIHPCTLCPAGSRNPGGAPATTCLKCSTSSFCPMGAAFDMDNASINTVSQSVAYPRPPEMTVYEDILLNNMVSFGSTAHCLRVSPMFWILILLLVIVVILLGMASLNLCVQEPKRSEWRAIIKNIFLRTDLVVSHTFGRATPAHGSYSRAKEKCGWVALRLSLSF